MWTLAAIACIGVDRPMAPESSDADKDTSILEDQAIT